MATDNAWFKNAARALATYYFNGAHQSGTGLVIPNGPPLLFTQVQDIKVYLALCTSDPRPFNGPGPFSSPAEPFNLTYEVQPAQYQGYNRVGINRYTTQWTVTVDPGGNSYIEVTNTALNSPITFPAPGGASGGCNITHVLALLQGVTAGVPNGEFWPIIAMAVDTPIAVPLGGGVAPNFANAADIKFRFTHQA